MGVNVIMSSSLRTIQSKEEMVRVSHFRNLQEFVGIVRSNHEIGIIVYLHTGRVKNIKSARRTDRNHNDAFALEYAQTTKTGDCKIIF